MYDVDIHTDIARLNEAGMRTRTFFFRHVTESERVRLWGRIIAARPFNRKSHYHLWGDHTDIDGISEAPNFQKYMPHWHLKHNCAKVKYNKTTPGACPNTLGDVQPADSGRHHANDADVNEVWTTMDETMSAHAKRAPPRLLASRASRSSSKNPSPWGPWPRQRVIVRLVSWCTLRFRRARVQRECTSTHPAWASQPEAQCTWLNALLQQA